MYVFTSAWIALLIILALGGALLLRALPGLLRGRERLLHTVRLLLLILYTLTIIFATVLVRSPGVNYRLLISPFWSYRRAFALTGNGPLLGFTVADMRMFKFIVLNILLYIPLGYLLPFGWSRILETKHFKPRSRLGRRLASFPWAVVLAGMGLSIMIEFSQLVFKLGYFEFDDIFNNTLGCFLGVILYLLLLKPKAPGAKRPDEGGA